MNFKESWDIYQKAIDSGHKIWGYFSAVSLAVVGYVVAWDKVAWTWHMFFIVALGYLVFSYANRKVLLVAQAEVIEAGKAVLKVRQQFAATEGSPELELNVTTVSKEQVGLFHSIMTCVVLLAIGVTWWVKH